jgi:DNA-binding MurR/RpiR family transcriptional regulator
MTYHGTIPKTQQWEIRLRGVMSSLGAQERRFAEYLLSNIEAIIQEPLADLAEASGVSEATIVRLCHRIGYSGTKELKIIMAREQSCPETEPMQGSEGGLATLKEKVFIGAVRALQDTMDLVDDGQIERATVALCRADHITVYALGGSVPVARHFKHQFMKLGIASNVYNEFRPSIIAAEKYSEGDVAIAITNSGETPEVLEALRSANSKGATTICITTYKNSSITKDADIKLFTTAETLLTPDDNSLSRIAETAIVNLLYCNVAEKYNQYKTSAE